MKIMKVNFTSPCNGIGYLILNRTGEYLMDNLPQGRKIDFDIGVLYAFIVMEDGTNYEFKGKDDFLYVDWL